MFKIVSASTIEVGHKVEHCGEWYEVLDVRLTSISVCCIIPNGGRISFFPSSKVKVSIV